MNFKDKNVFITGINGFVGSILGKRLADEGANVFGLVRNKSINLDNTNSIFDNINIIEGDLLNKDSLYNALSLEEIGFNIDKIETFNSGKTIKNPTELDKSKVFGVNFDKTYIDYLMLEEGLSFNLKDKGIYACSGNNKILIEFNPDRFRPADSPILLSDTRKIQKIGVKNQFSINNIINDQISYFSHSN